MRDKQVIVTGAFGFLGRHVARTFSENGFIVTGLGHGTWLRSEWEKWGLSEWHPCDITMSSLDTYVHEPDVVVHCAGSGSVGYSITHPMQDFERTLLTSLIVLEFLRLHAPLTHFIYPSSAAVYGNVEKIPIIESSPLTPISPYGVHKKMTEEICLSYASHFSIPVAIVRFFSLYGPGLRKQLLWDICKKIESDDLVFFGSGEEIRDWLHVEDAANLLFLISSHASSNGIIMNGATGIGTSVREIIYKVNKEMNQTKKPVFSQCKKPGDPLKYIANVNRARSLGWTPKKFLNEGIIEYVKWYKSGEI